MNILIGVALLFHVVQNDTISGTVYKVRDGDTIEILASGKKIPVRLRGVDSPDKCQNGFEEARQFTKETLLNKTVKFVQTDTDRFERAVGDIFIDAENTRGEFGIWFNQILVTSGNGWHWPKYSDSKKLSDAQKFAQRAKAGLWKNQNPVPPWEFRKTETYLNCQYVP
jgi:micrococcal nuclease